MRPLDAALVEEVWLDLLAYEPERSEAEARGFVEQQPHLVALAERLTREFDRETQKTALGLLFLLTKVIEAHREAPVASVSRERLGAAYRASVEWLERWEGADPQVLAQSVELARPQLAPYLVARFYPGGTSPAAYEAEIKASLFLLLQTAVDAYEGPSPRADAGAEA